MTEFQQFMLSVCFGVVVGMLIGNLISIIGFTVSDIKEKRLKRKAEKESASKEE